MRVQLAVQRLWIYLRPRQLFLRCNALRCNALLRVQAIAWVRQRAQWQAQHQTRNSWAIKNTHLHAATALIVSFAALLAACGQSSSGQSRITTHQRSGARTISTACGTPSKDNRNSESTHNKNSKFAHKSSTTSSSGTNSSSNCKNTSNASNTSSAIRPLSSVSVDSANTSVPGFQHLVAVHGPEAQAALSAWYAGWIGFDKAIRTMDWNYPEFVDNEGSAQLARIQKWMQNAKARGYIGVGYNYFAWAMVISISSNKPTSGPNGGTLPQDSPFASVVVTNAVVKACIIADETPVKASTGKPMPGFSLSANAEYISSTMIQITGRPWKVLAEHAIERNTKQCER